MFCFFLKVWGWPGSREREKASVHTTPTACKTPTLAVWVPRWTEAARTEAVRKERGPRRPGLQVLTEAGIVPSGDGSGGWGNRKGHVHTVNIYMHTLRLSPPTITHYISPVTSPSHLDSLPAPTRSRSSRPGHPAFLRPLWERGRLGIRGQAESKPWQAGTQQACF